MNVGEVTEDFKLVNVDEIMLKVEDLRFQLEHHANYFEDRHCEVIENCREISKKKLELEYFSYSKILNNLCEEVKKIGEIVNQTNER